MKKRNLIFMISILVFMWLLAYYTMVIKIPSYLYIRSLQLPEDTVNIKTKVEVSDDALYHIAAERLIYTSYTEDELNRYIDKNNNTSAYATIYFDETEFPEWDWQVISNLYIVCCLLAQTWRKVLIISHTPTAAICSIAYSSKFTSQSSFLKSAIDVRTEIWGENFSL